MCGETTEQLKHNTANPLKPKLHISVKRKGKNQG
jgi:hypothetical protein